jgi:amino-acid N-acetyltransferase
MAVEPAMAPDLPAVLALLERLDLPVEGVAQCLGRMVVAKDDGHVIGVAAVESYAHGALLRSVVVDPANQGKGLGQQLVTAALEMARQDGAEAVFLLTTTAERFFPRFGFVEIPWTELPSPVRASVEFQSACPASAVAMRAAL